MIPVAKIQEMVKVLGDQHDALEKHSLASDKESLGLFISHLVELKDSKAELELIVAIFTSNIVDTTQSKFIEMVAEDAYSDAEKAVQNAKTFLRQKI